MSALVYIFVGLATLLSSWVPLLLRNRPLSLPILAVTAGWLIGIVAPHPADLALRAPFLEHATEVVLLAAIHGAGLRVDRRFRFSTWNTTWRLLLILMPLSVGALTGMSLLLGLPLGLAIILGAALAPTDPVLAAEVQLGPPGVGEQGEVRFGLTTEAGLNDGLALPFVLLGITLFDGGGPGQLLNWAGLHLVLGTLGGAALGVALGLVMVGANRLLPERYRLHSTKSGLVGLALAFLTYGICEAIDSNGFVAVFFQAVAIRNGSGTSEYFRQISSATEQIEQALSALVLAAFGVGLGLGLLDGITLAGALFAIVTLLVVRPACTWIATIGTSYATTRDRLGLSYFGIRGISTLYYAAYVASHRPEAWVKGVAAPLSLTVLFSIVLYGVTGEFAARRLIREADREDGRLAQL